MDETTELRPVVWTDEEYAEIIGLIVDAARIASKGITTRSESDMLSRLLVRLAQGDAAYADSAKLRAAFESHRLQTDDWKAACQELESTQGDLEQELQRLQQERDEALDQAKYDRNDRERFMAALERVTAIKDTLHAENMRLKGELEPMMARNAQLRAMVRTQGAIITEWEKGEDFKDIVTANAVLGVKCTEQYVEIAELKEEAARLREQLHSKEGVDL